MAFATGSANSISDLLTALQNACTANGWTLTSGVLARGDCRVKAAVSGAMLTLQAGIGDDGAGNLVTPSPVTYLRAPLTAEPLTYPCVWFAHVSTSEVYFVVKCAVDAYIMVGFGQSPVSGLPGTGVWINGNSQVTSNSLQLINSGSSGSFYSANNAGSTSTCGLFFSRSPNNQCALSHYVHHGLDGATWSSAYGNTNAWGGLDLSTNATYGAIDLMTRCSPSAWNGETILVPVQPIVYRTSGFVSIIADLTDARFVRLDALLAEQVVTLGSDRWKMYPFYRRNVASRTPSTGNNLTHSGTFGIAIRYDGP